MDNEIIFASSILLPCAATKPDHAVRKAELDELTAALNALAERVTALEPITYLAAPVINGYNYNKGNMSVDFRNSPNATHYRIEVVIIPYGTVLYTDSNYTSNSVIALNKEGYEGESCRGVITAIMDSLESTPSYTDVFSL